MTTSDRRFDLAELSGNRELQYRNDDEGRYRRVEKILPSQKSSELTAITCTVTPPFLREHSSPLKAHPSLDFRQAIASVGISGESSWFADTLAEWSWPKEILVEKVKGSVEYIGSMDTTLRGSRDGFLGSGYGRRCAGAQGGLEGAHRGMHGPHPVCLTEAETDRLARLGESVLQYPGDPATPEAIVRKWHLATEKDIAHLIIMPGVSEAMIDKFVADLAGIYYERLKASDTEALVEAVQATFPGPSGETMARALKMTPEEYLSYTRLVCEKAALDGLCVVAKDHFWGRIFVGFCISEDFLSLPAYKNEKISEKFQPLLDLLETLDAQYARSRSIAPGGVLHLYLLGACEPNGPDAGLARSSWKQQCESEKEAGFKVAIAEATGAGSQQICEKLGFKTVGEVEYWNYRYNGRLVFGSVENPRSCLLVEKPLSS